MLSSLGGVMRKLMLIERREVCLSHIADVPLVLTNVRFEEINGHDADVTRCLLMTQSGHVRAQWGIVTFNRT
jgi:hypothetical protein